MPGLPVPQGGAIVAAVEWTGQGNAWSRHIGLELIRPGETVEAARLRVLRLMGFVA